MKEWSRKSLQLHDMPPLLPSQHRMRQGALPVGEFWFPFWLVTKLVIEQPKNLIARCEEPRRWRPAYLIKGSNRAPHTDARENWRVMAATKCFRIAVVVFSPEVIEIMSAALEASVSALPEPVSAAHVHRLAESILHSAEAGERDVDVLRRIALVELRITPRN